MQTLELLYVQMWAFQEFQPVSNLDMPNLRTLIFATKEDRAILLLNEEVVMNAKKLPVWFPVEVKRLVHG